MRGIEWLNRLARRHDIKLRQSFLRVGRKGRRDASRLIHGRGHKQAMRWVRKLRTWLGRLDREIGRRIVGDAQLEAAFAVARERVALVLTQKAGDSDKLYALHAPEVECIAKGKARTRYVFGVKTSIAVTNARTAGGQFIVGMQALPGSPYDGHTLTGQIAQIERLTGVTVERAYVDRGHRGHKHDGPAKVYIAHSRGSRHRPSGANCDDETRSSRSSVTPKAMACSSETTSPVPPGMRSTSCSSAPGTTCAF